MVVKNNLIQGGCSFIEYYISIINRQFSADPMEDASVKFKYFNGLVEYAFQTRRTKRNIQALNLDLRTLYFYRPAENKFRKVEKKPIRTIIKRWGMILRATARNRHS